MKLYLTVMNDTSQGRAQEGPEEGGRSEQDSSSARQRVGTGFK